jgi:hypothetical protein
MKRLILSEVLVLFAVLIVHAQDPALGVLTSDGYTNSVLGFRYTPPSSLPLDQTSFVRDDMQKRATAAHRTSSSAVLLRLVSGPEDTAPDWASLSVATFSRASWPDVDDLHAETRMNVSMARGGLPVGDNKSVTFSNMVFVCTQFEMHEGPITKHASVYTTIRRGKLLTFAFSGNSAENVNRIADSLKSLAFSGPN